MRWPCERGSAKRTSDFFRANGKRTKKPINIKKFGGTPPLLDRKHPVDLSCLSCGHVPFVPQTFCPIYVRELPGLGNWSEMGKAQNSYRECSQGCSPKSGSTEASMKDNNRKSTFASTLRSTPASILGSYLGVLPFRPVSQARKFPFLCGIAHEKGRDVPGLAPGPTPGHYRGTPTTKSLYVFLVYRSFFSLQKGRSGGFSKLVLTQIIGAVRPTFLCAVWQNPRHKPSDHLQTRHASPCIPFLRCQSSGPFLGTEKETKIPIFGTRCALFRAQPLLRVHAQGVMQQTQSFFKKEVLLRRVLRRLLQGVSVKTRFLEGFLEGSVSWKVPRRQKHVLSQSMTPFACTLLIMVSARASSKCKLSSLSCVKEFRRFLG